MNKIVKVQFGNTEISAGSENKITLVPTDWKMLVAQKRDANGHIMQEMILGTGCVITYQEVQA